MTRTFPPLIKPDPLRTWIRNATVQAIAYLEDETTEEVATRLYGHEGGGEVQKAAVNPASTDGWGSQLAAGVRVAAPQQGVRLAVLISERKDNIKLSFRSLGDFSVNDFARKHFDGGGHKNAAGGQTTLSFDETLKKFLDLLPRYQKELLND